MKVKFRSKKLQDLYYDEKGTEDYPEAAVAAFFKVMGILEAAADERDLYALKSLHFEKLAGERAAREERSLRLNDQWRLIILLERDGGGKSAVIVDIEKHYQRT